MWKARVKYSNKHDKQIQRSRSDQSLCSNLFSEKELIWYVDWGIPLNPRTEEVRASEKPAVNNKIGITIKICTAANDQLVLLFLRHDSENQQFACNQIQHLVLAFLSTCFISIHKHFQTFSLA